MKIRNTLGGIGNQILIMEKTLLLFKRSGKCLNRSIGEHSCLNFNVFMSIEVVFSIIIHIILLLLTILVVVVVVVVAAVVVIKVRNWDNFYSSL